MDNPDHHTLTAFALTLAQASARETLPRFRQKMTIDVKSGTDWDPVTEADRESERVIRALIESSYPDHAILGEEFGSKQSDSDYTWIIDPIDGTRAFVIGMPSWATLIGLYYRGQPFIGVMNQPYVGDLFVGNQDGAWKIKDGQKSKLASAASVTLRQTKVGTTTPHRYQGRDSAKFEHLRESVTLMRYGGDAYFFCLLAEGLLDIAMDPGLQIYDIAALIPIIKGAGGVVATWDGEDPAQGGNIIAASSKETLEQALAVMAAR